jgi:hypothetical protein
MIAVLSGAFLSSAALQFALDCAKARGAPSNKKPGDAGDVTCILGEAQR